MSNMKKLSGIPIDGEKVEKVGDYERKNKCSVLPGNEKILNNRVQRRCHQSSSGTLSARSFLCPKYINVSPANNPVGERTTNSSKTIKLRKIPEFLKPKTEKGKLISNDCKFLRKVRIDKAVDTNKLKLPLMKPLSDANFNQKPPNIKEKQGAKDNIIVKSSSKNSSRDILKYIPDGFEKVTKEDWLKQQQWQEQDQMTTIKTKIQCNPSEEKLPLFDLNEGIQSEPKKSKLASFKSVIKHFKKTSVKNVDKKLEESKIQTSNPLTPLENYSDPENINTVNNHSIMNLFEKATKKDFERHNAQTNLDVNKFEKVVPLNYLKDKYILENHNDSDSKETDPVNINSVVNQLKETTTIKGEDVGSPKIKIQTENNPFSKKDFESQNGQQKNLNLNMMGANAKEMIEQRVPKPKSKTIQIEIIPDPLNEKLQIFGSKKEKICDCHPIKRDTVMEIIAKDKTNKKVKESLVSQINCSDLNNMPREDQLFDKNSNKAILTTSGLGLSQKQSAKDHSPLVRGSTCFNPRAVPTKATTTSALKPCVIECRNTLLSKNSLPTQKRISFDEFTLEEIYRSIKNEKLKTCHIEIPESMRQEFKHSEKRLLTHSKYLIKPRSNVMTLLLWVAVFITFFSLASPFIRNICKKWLHCDAPVPSPSFFNRLKMRIFN